MNAGTNLNLKAQPKHLLRLFGPPALANGSVLSLSFPTKRALKLLAFLALEPGQSRTREEMAEFLWQGDKPAANKLKLRQELHRLGTVLSGCGPILIISRQAVAFNSAAFDSDVAIVRALCKSLESSPESEGERIHERILELTCAEFLENLDDDWSARVRGEFRVVRVRSLIALADGCRKRGQYERSIEFAEQAVELEPDNAAAGSALVQALMAAGQLEKASERQRALSVLARSKAEEKIQRSIPTVLTQELTVREPSVASGPIFGRRRELQRLEELLGLDSSERIVTITGAGGLGKTKLALEAMRRLSSTYRGRVFFIELADYSDPKLFLDAIVRALGLPPNPTIGSIQAIRIALGSPLAAVLALDNLEQFGDLGAQIVARLLNEVEGLKILATSRGPIDVDGERVFRLKPLSLKEEDLGDALAMFESVAQRFDAKFAIDESNRALLTEILHLLEGIPLSIRLAASRVRALGISSLRRALSDRFTILDSSSEMTSRHRNLKNCLDWSYELLPPEYRVPFGLLTVFRDGFTPEQAAIVSQVAPVEDLLKKLEAHSFIFSSESEDGVRYRMLESIREYGASRLSLADQASAHMRHMKAIIAFCEQFTKGQIGEDQAIWFRKADAEYANALEALSWGLHNDQQSATRVCGAYSRYWLVRGLQGMGRKVLDGVLRDHSGPKDKGYADCLWAYANMCLDQFDVPNAERHYLMAKEVYLRVAQERVAGTLYNIGNLKILEWKYEEAVKAYSENLERVEADNARDVAFPLSGLAFANRGLGNLRIAKKLGLRSVDLARASKDPFCEEYRLLYMGAIHVDRLEFQEANTAITEGRSVGEKIGDKRGIALAIQFEAELRFLEGNPLAARELYTLAKEKWGFIGHRYRIAECALGIGRSWTLTDPPMAIAPLYEAYDLWERLRFMPGQLLACQALIRARSEVLGPHWTATMLNAATKYRLEYNCCFLPREQRIMSALEGTTIALLSPEETEACGAEAVAMSVKAYLKAMRG